MKNLLFNAAVIAAFFFSFYNVCFSQQFDSISTITLSITGDLMCHSSQFEYARIENNNFDFKPAFQNVKKYFQNSDFVIGNLETVTAGKSEGFSGYPFFNTPDEYISALKNAGFDLLTTSNNHSLDQGEKGVLRTIQEINKNDLFYNGTFISKKDRDSIRIFNIKGIKIAFLAYTYGTNGIPVPKNKQYLINLIDKNLIENNIKKARSENAEIIFVHLHWGIEYQREQNKQQKIIADEIIKLGADIIVGGHPHVLQPVNYFKTINGKLDTGFIAYSMGNFFSNQRWRYSDCGMILNISLTKNISSDSIYISNVTYTPTWVFKGKIKDKNEFKILASAEALKDTINFLTGEDKVKLKQSIEDTRETLTKYTSNISIFDLEKSLIKEIRNLAKPLPLENPLLKISLEN